MTIYEIDERLKVLEEYQVDSETGEMISDEEFFALYEEIEMNLQEKIENTICFAKNLDADVVAFKEEEKRIATRRQTKENLSKRLKARIDNYIRSQYTDKDGNIDRIGLNKYKLETPKMKISYRKSDTAQITNLEKVPSEFIKPHVITDKDVNTTEIKKIMKARLKQENDKLPKGSPQILDYDLGYATLTTNINMGIK